MYNSFENVCIFNDLYQIKEAKQISCIIDSRYPDDFEQWESFQ